MTQSRRAFVSLLPAAALGLASEKGAIFPSEMARYADSATEFTVLRLTDPAHTSLLPASSNRAVSRRSSFLLYANDRTGEFQGYRLDLKSGQSRQLTGVQGLRTSTLTLLPDEKTCCLATAEAVVQINLSNGREREVYRPGEGFESAESMNISEDGMFAALAERKLGSYRLRLVHLAKGTATTITEGPDEISDVAIRPRRAGVLYRRGGGELHVVNFDGARDQKLRTAAGRTGPAFWSHDGREVEYLNFSDDRKVLNSIRDYTPDANEDRLVAATTQYVQFGHNADSSVFVGASGSKASPYLLLLVRSVRRELTLCEHKASDPRQVAPIFSPNSQRVFFQTDRHGKLAIYSMAVERLVELTE